MISKEMFPLKGEITAEILQNAKIMERKSCIGALTLRAALAKVEGVTQQDLADISWGSTHGSIQGMWFTTEENLCMMWANPGAVTFIVTTKPQIKGIS